MVLHPLDNPPPGVLVLGKDLSVVSCCLDGSLGQIVGSLDCANKGLGSLEITTVVPAVHRLLKPVGVHLNDGEELQ